MSAYVTDSAALDRDERELTYLVATLTGRQPTWLARRVARWLGLDRIVRALAIQKELMIANRFAINLVRPAASRADGALGNQVSQLAFLIEAMEEMSERLRYYEQAVPHLRRAKEERDRQQAGAPG